MGLDGISVNQLRTSEYTPSESLALNSKVKKNKIIDGLSDTQIVHSEKEKNQNQQEFEEKEDDTKNKQSDEPQIIEYDLSDTNKYKIKVDDKTGNMLIIETETKNIIQIFSPQTLSRLTQHLNSHKGVFVNREY